VIFSIFRTISTNVADVHNYIFLKTRAKLGGDVVIGVNFDVMTCAFKKRQLARKQLFQTIHALARHSSVPVEESPPALKIWSSEAWKEVREVSPINVPIICDILRS